jgi:Flp pilus assembly pilin Flp
MAMMSQIRSLVRDDRGEDLIEYGLLAAFIGGVALALLRATESATIRTALSDALRKAQSALTHV